MGTNAHERRSVIRSVTPEWAKRIVRAGRWKMGPPPTLPEYRALLDKIVEEAVILAREVPKTGLKVLLGPSFAIYPPSFVHDRLIAAALLLRGVSLSSIYCDAIQEVECNYFGGAWTSRSLAENCVGCQSSSRDVYQGLGDATRPVSRYLDAGDREWAASAAASCGEDDWTTFEHDGLPIGRWAKDITVNNHVVGDYRLLPNHATLGRAQVRNLLLLRKGYERVLDEVKPNRILANDSYYGMWAILQHLARRRGIPFYSQWGGVRRGGWCYARDDAAMNLDIRASWEAFSKKPLGPTETAEVEAWLRGRISGAEMILDTASPCADGSFPEELGGLDHARPTALLAANVIWDLAALDKQVVFIDMMDWIVRTIEWFSERPQYQLIVKPHPAELHPAIPETRERVGRMLEERGIRIPSNVVVLPSRSRVTVYELFGLAKTGLVHTTTVGLEMAAADLRVVTTGSSPYRGFGFTVDPVDASDYFEMLDRSLRGERSIEPVVQRDLSWKFIRLYQFHYPIRSGLVDYVWGKEPEVLVQSAEALLPGKNEALDYVIDSILRGLPVMGAERWPPAT